MLNVGAIKEGFVLDHIKAGMSLSIYHDLKLDELDCCVAIIKNAKSNKMGKKDILKVECNIDNLDLDILGFIDHNITVNIIKDQRIVEKRALKLPTSVTNVIKCKNPRCITSIEQELDQIFLLTAIGNSVILTASMIVRKLFMKKGMTQIISTHFRFHPTGRITAMISISIPIHAIRSHLILRMYRMKIHAVLMCTASHTRNRKEPQLTI